MIGESRPLRFVMVIVGGWIGVRVALLWPAYDPAAVLMAASSAAPVSRPARAEPPSPAFGGSIDGGSRRGPVRARATMPRLSPPYLIADASEQAVPLIAPARFVAAVETGRATPTTAQFPIGAPLPVERGPVATRARLAGSAWLIARGAGPAAPFTPQLGGSQAGARLTYALGDSRRIAIAARLSSALAMRQREAAIGLDWQPTALPVHLFAEQRVALAGGRGGPAIGVIAGLPSTRIAAGFSLDGYGQAGAIGRNGGEGFVDAAAHVTRPVAAIGKARIELGLGAWGGAQRGAARRGWISAPRRAWPFPRSCRYASRLTGASASPAMLPRHRGRRCRSARISRAPETAKAPAKPHHINWRHARIFHRRRETLTALSWISICRSPICR